MNRLSYFIRIEGDDSANRADPFEAIKVWLQPDTVTLKVVDFEVSAEKFAAPMIIRKDHHMNYNLYCMYAGHTGDFGELTAENAESVIERMRIDESCMKLGEQAVVVHNPKEFMRRVSEAISSSGYCGSANLVEYYSPEPYHGHFNDEDVVFRKRDEYSHQREYRICADTKTAGDEPLVLNIGNIEDIASPAKTSEINATICVNRENA